MRKWDRRKKLIERYRERKNKEARERGREREKMREREKSIDAVSPSDQWVPLD